MADVTKEVIATEGLYQLKDGDTVDVADLMCTFSRWYNKNCEEGRSPQVLIHLVAGGVTLRIDAAFEAMDPEGDTAKLRRSEKVLGEYLIYVFAATPWRGAEEGEWRDEIVTTIPATLSNDFVVFKSKYGSSLLEGIVIEYYDIADEFKLSA